MRVANEEQASNVAPAGDHMRTGNVDCRERGATLIHGRVRFLERHSFIMGLGAWPDGRCHMPPSRIITDKYHKTGIFAGEMYSTIRVEWAGDHFGLGLT